jgi:hypothetical protein
VAMAGILLFRYDTGMVMGFDYDRMCEPVLDIVLQLCIVRV